VLSGAQNTALYSIKEIFRDKDISLLHGVTSSGKTEIYIHLIEEELKKGRQVLYLLPEISLTAQIIQRLNKHFGAVTGIYTCFSNEKVEYGTVSQSGYRERIPAIIGARSAIFFHSEPWTGNC
jgi:primosomal protein N' (replication factor Y)